MNKLELFLDKSALVGNENQILSADEFKNLLGKESFEYIDVQTFSKLKDIQAGEAGIKSALVEVDFAIAETGTVVIDSCNENKRLATCLAEKLFVVMPISKLVASLNDVADFIEERTADMGGYVAFITGASRTADIERVLTVGVHGPKEMTVYILNDL
ncbi:lactate utilization protein [Labilibaculum sp. DW002]|uniref:Lactate utilization protein n=1 Tax=Paralabilibaculum antarcticum TaxID=2912572 RepID=A0ABT5VY29_9BACT|nr:MULTISPECIES: lactate utilization protein [unclassified Labilibaculum]MBI9058887.1 lactate utilization protein [Labilibaculum sp.]MDE5420322.1 lactate utilization protein [Labilibaculum sp. DW002]